jgi:hypothetical protein
VSTVSKGSKKELAWARERKRLNASEATPEEYMIHQLEKRWGTEVHTRCPHCLATAFHESSGYVTDDELIASSGGRLKRK